MIIILLIGLTLRTPFSMCVWSLAMLCVSISFAVIVKNNAESRELDNGKVWAVMSFFFGLPVVALYFLMNIKLGVNPSSNKAKTAQRNAWIVCAVAVVISVSITPLFIYESKQADLQNEYESSEYKAYLNEEGTHYICYDKMGNEYPYDEYEIPFYTRDGVKLTSEDYLDYEIPSIGDGYDYDTNYIRYVSANGKIRIDYKNAVVDKDGYMVDIPIKTLKEVEIESDEDYLEPSIVYKDKKGNYYYDPDTCSWDKNGNLVFGADELTRFYEEHQ